LSGGAIQLKILLPTRVFADERVSKVNAEGKDGHFSLLPRHVDFVSSLVPGILSYEIADTGEEIHAAVDEGTLVKQGATVWVSARDAIRGPELGELRQAVADRFQGLDERERTVRSAAAKIEAGFVRRFLEIQRRG